MAGRAAGFDFGFFFKKLPPTMIGVRKRDGYNTTHHEYTPSFEKPQANARGFRHKESRRRVWPLRTRDGMPEDGRQRRGRRTFQTTPRRASGIHRGIFSVRANARQAGAN